MVKFATCCALRCRQHGMRKGCASGFVRGRRETGAFSRPDPITGCISDRPESVRRGGIGTASGQAALRASRACSGRPRSGAPFGTVRPRPSTPPSRPPRPPARSDRRGSTDGGERPPHRRRKPGPATRSWKPSPGGAGAARSSPREYSRGLSQVRSSSALGGIGSQGAREDEAPEGDLGDEQAEARGEACRQCRNGLRGQGVRAKFRREVSE